MGADIDDPLGVPFQQLLHMGQNCMPVAGPCHNVGFLNFCRFLGKGLWVTTGQHGYGAGVFPFLAAKPFPAFLIAEICDGTTVDNINVGLFSGGGDGVTA